MIIFHVFSLWNVRLKWSWLLVFFAVWPRLNGKWRLRGRLLSHFSGFLNRAQRLRRAYIRSVKSRSSSLWPCCFYVSLDYHRKKRLAKRASVLVSKSALFNFFQLTSKKIENLNWKYVFQWIIILLIYWLVPGDWNQRKIKRFYLILVDDFRWKSNAPKIRHDFPKLV